MVQHIVMWALKEGIDPEDTFAKMKEIFGEFSPKVPGLASLEIHRCFNGYDLCLTSLHQNRQALEAYQTFPAHLEAKKFVHSVIQNRASGDFEI